MSEKIYCKNYCIMDQNMTEWMRKVNGLKRTVQEKKIVSLKP